MSTTSPGLRAALLERFLRDRAAGALRRHDDYARDYPGFEAEVGEEYDRFVGSTPPPVTPTDPFEAAFERDRAAGSVRALADYLNEFPDAGRRIAERFAELVAAEADAGRAGADAIEELPAGRKVGPYVVAHRLGGGGQGDVYLADEPRLERRVALKVLRGGYERRPAALERLRREAAYASRLDHPGICAVYGADCADGVAYVAMRFVEGETLATQLRRERRAGERSATPDELRARVAFLEAAALAVHAAHEARLVHRDLKPGNLMVTPRGEPVVLDFGLAIATESDDATLTGSGDLFGTPAYMSPEQASGNRDRVDARSDVWSLGVVLYELLTLELPFQGPSRSAILRQIEESDPVDPRRHVPSLPRDLAAIVLAALEKDRERRYGSAAAFADDLAAFREGRPVSVVVPGWIERTVRLARRRPAQAALVLLAVLALAAAAGVSGFLLAQRPALATGMAELARRDVEEAVLAGMGFGGGRHAWTSSERLQELLARDPHQALARAVLLVHFLETGAAEAGLAWTRMPEGIAPAPDEEQMMKRMRAALLRALDRTAEAEVVTRSLSTEVWPVEQLAAAKIEWRNHLNGDPGAAARALDLVARAIFLSPRAELLFHAERARFLADVYPSDSRLNGKAHDSARALETLWPDHALALVWAAQMTYKFDVARSAELTHRAATLDPDLSQAWLMWAGAQLSLHHDDVAEEAYRSAIAAAKRTEPSREWLVHQNYGIGLLSMRGAARARPVMETAVRLAPKERSASRFLVKVLEKAEDPDALRAELERRVAVDAADGFAWFKLANACLAEGDEESAHSAAAEADAHRTWDPADPKWSGDLDKLLRRLEAGSDD
jgi:Tfp pilus assembly protein PilF